MIHKGTTYTIICISYRSYHRTVVTCSYCGDWTTLFLEGNADVSAHIVDDGDEALLECALDPKVLPASLTLDGLEGLELGEHGGRAVLAILQMKAVEGGDLDVEVLLRETLDPDHTSSLLLAAEFATDGT